MIVRAANENFFPRLCVRGRKIVTIGERVDFVRRQLFKKRLGQIAKERIAQAVNALEMFEEKNELLEVCCLKFSIHAVKRMRDCMRNLRCLEVTL